MTSKTPMGPVTFFSSAVGDREGEQPFYADPTAATKGGSEMDSLSPVFNNESSLEPMTTVKVTTIDVAVGASPVVYAKIDTQGWDGKVLLGAQKTIRDGRLPILTMEVTPRLAPNGFESYMHGFELLAHHAYRCFDCDTSRSAQMPWMKHVPFPKLGRYQTVLRLRDLYNHTVIARGVNQGGWTNVVCTTDVNLWGSSSSTPADELERS